jgi:hypothetical protein
MNTVMGKVTVLEKYVENPCGTSRRRGKVRGEKGDRKKERKKERKQGVQ